MPERRVIRLDGEDLVRMLARLPLLAGVPEEDLRHIADRAHLVSFSAGEVIVREGEEGLGFYLIVSGAGRVVKGDAEIARLRGGDFFGEESLLEWSPRTATVLAGEPTVCLGILRSDFKEILVRNPRLALRILEEEARRVSERGTIRPAPE